MKKQNPLASKLSARKAKIGVIGLGYVGLPLATEFAKAGFHVTGFEVDTRKVDAIIAGKSYIEDIATSTVQELVHAKQLTATVQFSNLRTMDVIIICVPTPLRKTKDPDISYIAESAKQIAKYLRRGQLIVLESTTYPGTTRDFVLPILEAGGLKGGKDFYLAFSPERIDPGNKEYQLPNTPKVVGGLTPVCGEVVSVLYAQIVRQVVTVSTPEAAELVKLLENTFRAVNIGLVNEMALICDRLNLNVWEVIEAAATKPYGFMPFYPGPGLGGHCIPIDPHYLSWKMKSLNFSARFIELAGEVNSHMPEFALEKISRTLNNQKKAINGSKILVMGVAYKANVSDMRESPALDLIHLLHQQGASVDYHDPFVPSVTIGEQKYINRKYSPKMLKSYDAVVVTTAHKCFEPREILDNASLVIDTRNMMRGLTAPHLIRL